MSRRVTPKPDPDDFPSMRERNPAMWWIAIVTVAAVVLGTFASALIIVLA